MLAYAYGIKRFQLRYSRSLQVNVLQLHGSRGSDGSQALASDTAGASRDGLGAGNLVGSRVTILQFISISIE